MTNRNPNLGPATPNDLQRAVNCLINYGRGMLVVDPHEAQTYAQLLLKKHLKILHYILC